MPTCIITHMCLGIDTHTIRAHVVAMGLPHAKAFHSVCGGALLNQAPNSQLAQHAMNRLHWPVSCFCQASEVPHCHTSHHYTRLLSGSGVSVAWVGGLALT